MAFFLGLTRCFGCLGLYVPFAYVCDCGRKQCFGLSGGVQVGDGGWFVDVAEGKNRRLSIRQGGGVADPTSRARQADGMAAAHLNVDAPPRHGGGTLGDPGQQQGEPAQ